ncbi:hypothetical protein [Ralstonia syzygii]|uniref:hypothetical protein n=1 Tax=Ralstonia syzygii TaxID=28097 RepID=UPI003515EC0B
MSLEVAIQENTAAIRDLIAAIASGAALPAAAEKVVAAASKPRAEAKQEAAAPASTEGGEKGAVEVSYNDAASVITKLSRGKGRDAALKVLQQFGADNLKGVKPEQFADVMAAAQKALEA